MESEWNFQGYIAVPLEGYARKYISDSSFTADDIACGEFVDAMLLILSVTYGDLKSLSEFVEQCKPYAGLSYNDISPEVADTIFNDFKLLMKNFDNRS